MTTATQRTKSRVSSDIQAGVNRGFLGGIEEPHHCYNVKGATRRHEFRQYVKKLFKQNRERKMSITVRDTIHERASCL